MKFKLKRIRENNFSKQQQIIKQKMNTNYTIYYWLYSFIIDGVHVLNV
jgi:hypothetical protein